MAENGVSIYSILQNPIKDPNDSQVPTHTGAPNPMTPRPAPSGAPNLRTSKNDPSLSPAFFSPAFFSPASFSPASFSPAFFSPAFFSHSPVLRSCPHGGKFVVMTDPVDVSAVKAACVKIEAADWCLGESFYMPVL